jgi:3',5'-cyclic AMP phosphodiesterase CpdA
MFSLAHLSDPHLPLPPGGAPLLTLTGKQLLSRLAWQRKRRHITQAPVLAALANDLAAHVPDHIAVTGDLVNLGTPSERRSARAWLTTLGAPETVSVVPGNHDCLRQPDDAAFPYLHRRGQIALIGLNSGLPTPMFMASGRLGAAQLQKTAALLAQAGADGLFRVVLIHHPPVIGDGGTRKALRDRATLAAILHTHGAELVLHGHHHRSRLTMLPGPIPVIGVPSASAGVPQPELGGWNLFRIAPGERLTAIARRYDPISRGFTTAGEWSMRIGEKEAVLF